MESSHAPPTGERTFIPPSPTAASPTPRRADDKAAGGARCRPYGTSAALVANSGRPSALGASQIHPPRSAPSLVEQCLTTLVPNVEFITTLEGMPEHLCCVLLKAVVARGELNSMEKLQLFQQCGHDSITKWLRQFDLAAFETAARPPAGGGRYAEGVDRSR